MGIILLSIGVAQATISDAGLIPVIQAYLGPETMMPLASAIAGAVGVGLIFWQRVTMMIRNAFKRVFSKKEDEVFTDSSSLESDSRN
jgi:hypothetical protein